MKQALNQPIVPLKGPSDISLHDEATFQPDTTENIVAVLVASHHLDESAKRFHPGEDETCASTGSLEKKPSEEGVAV